MEIFVFNDSCLDDKRVAITQDVAAKLVQEGHNVIFEDIDGIDAIKSANITISINPQPLQKLKKIPRNATYVAMQKIHQHQENMELFKKNSITAFALDMIPRTTKAQYMDVLSSQSSLAGYRAVIEASYMMDKAIPMMMTTAGTIPAAKFLIVGAGVAGLQAIATAKRLGAIVTAFDVRAAAKEQAESLGAKFIDVNVGEKMDGVYAGETSEEYKKAQREALLAVLPKQDVIITTAQIPQKQAPVIIDNDMVNIMKSGALIIDLASETGGNCSLTKHGEVVEHNGVKIVGFKNILNGIAHDASQLFAKNVYAFLKLLFSISDIKNCEDEIINKTLLPID